MAVSLPLRFHWSPSAGAGRDAGALASVCRCAEACGIESVLVNIESTLENPLAPLVAAGGATRNIKLMAGCGTGPVAAGTFAQQAGALAERLPGRILIFIPFDPSGRPIGDGEGAPAAEEQYVLIQELLAACCTLWAPRPEIFLEGDSAEAAVLAIKFADCLWHSPKGLEAVRADAMPVLHIGKEVGLRVSPVARATTEEARSAASMFLPAFLPASGDEDGNELSGGVPCLWKRAGAGGKRAGAGGDPDGMALVGSFAEVAGALMRYKEKGVSQFLFSGSPDEREMMHFAQGVLPLVRERERDATACLRRF